MSKQKSVIVCGGGIIGLCCAYHLARDGAQVTLVDRHGPNRDHCALGSAGYVSPSHVIPLASPGMVMAGLKWMFDPRGPFHVKPRLSAEFLRWSWLFWRSCSPRNVERGAPVLRDLCVQSRELFSEFHADGGGSGFDFEKRGLLNLCRTEAGMEHEIHGLARVAERVGIEAKVLSAAEVRAMNPGVRIETVGAVFFPIDAHLTPARYASALAGALTGTTVKFQWNTTIEGWRTENGRIAAVQTSAGDLEADEFVLAGGSWSPEMIGELGVRLPMEAGKGYSLTLPNPPARTTVPMILVERRAAVTPMGGSMRFGGTMELSGRNAIVRTERVEQIINVAGEYLPDFQPEHFAGIKPWFGLRPVSADGLPYIGRFEKYRNLVAACGHAMLGLTMAPITGKLVTEVIHGRKPSVDLTLLKPDRFA